MIEQFFDEHRDLRLFQIRLKDKGQEYLYSHKSDLINLLSDIDAKVTKLDLSQSQQKIINLLRDSINILYVISTTIKPLLS